MSVRADRYLARVDEHLPGLSAENARHFLAQQRAAWEFRYEQFQFTEGKSEPCADHGDPPQAADFLLVITGLAARQAEREPKAAA